MTATTEPSRRRFLAYLAALAGVGALGGLAWLERRDPAGEAAAGSTTSTTSSTSTTSPATSTTTTTTTTTSTTSTTAGPPETTVAPDTEQLVAICPEGWGALPVAGTFTSHTIERLTVHHTAALLGNNTDAPGHARQHQQFHQDRGWPDLAYHFLIDANGNVYEGRPVEAVGDTGTDYDPTGHFLVCCEGNFSQQALPDAQLEALIDMLAWAAGEYGVSPSTITGHRDWAATACPGDDLYAHIQSGYVEQAVATRLAGGGPGMRRICGDEAADLVADIEAGRA